MPNRGKLIVFSAPSGAGKTTLINMLRKYHSYLEFSISATTRQPRGKEVDGREYFFLSREQFKKKIECGEFIEYKTVYKNLYGTPKDFVERALNEGRNIIFDVDVQGGLAIKQSYPDDSLLIFIYPPSLDILRERLLKRGTDSAETIEIRLKAAQNEMKVINEYHFRVMNGEISKAYNDLSDILKENNIIK